MKFRGVFEVVKKDGTKVTVNGYWFDASLVTVEEVQRLFVPSVCDDKFTYYVEFKNEA